MILCDHEIRTLCWNEPALITPFVDSYPPGAVSYGLTSAGYDLRLAPQVLVFKATRAEVVDPKRFKDAEYKKLVFDEYVADKEIVLPAHSYILVQSVEYIRMPRNLKGRCVGKSTYARCGVIVNTTPLEPGWEGTLTIEISNSNPSPVKLYVGEGIAQLEFDRIEEPQVDYAAKGGKYQNQREVTPAR
jgi:dCTP deaminase